MANKISPAVTVVCFEIFIGPQSCWTIDACSAIYNTFVSGTMACSFSWGRAEMMVWAPVIRNVLDGFCEISHTKWGNSGFTGFGIKRGLSRTSTGAPPQRFVGKLPGVHDAPGRGWLKCKDVVGYWYRVCGKPWTMLPFPRNLLVGILGWAEHRGWV